MGHFTHQAYNFCRTRERRRVFAVRGDPQPSKMVKGKATIQDVNWQGKVLKRGVRLWYVGTDTAKDLIYGRLLVTQPGPGYVHFSRDLPPQFYNQLTAEARMPTRTARGVEFKWVNPKRARNEVLDCTVYALFCTHALACTRTPTTCGRASKRRWSRTCSQRLNPCSDAAQVPAPTTTRDEGRNDGKNAAASRDW
jgi:phage terminase large subunit GpA-like protein